MHVSIFSVLWSEAPNQPKMTQEVAARQDLMQSSTGEGKRRELVDQGCRTDSELNCDPRMPVEANI